ncbi:lysine-specific demethylase JMJ29-like [Malus domestica]|uniref:lysine-specific demethylase JMJ29-like n=1 Tax=Malus domestica TaxID=3750 RepID=UPI00397586C2
MAEVVAIRVALMVCIEMGCDEVEVESDSQWERVSVSVNSQVSSTNLTLQVPASLSLSNLIHQPSEMSAGEGRKRPRKSSEMSAGEDTSSDKDKGSLGNPNDGLTKGGIEEEKKRLSHEWNEEDDSLLCHCHQCKRNDKGRYPHMSEEAIAEACPICLGNCNCKACLRLEKLKNLLEFHICKDDAVEHSKYLLQALLPFFKRLNDEQMIEIEIEARRQGKPISELKILRSDCPEDDRIYCNNSKLLFLDFHRSCPKCSYDLCLTCCREIRDGHLQGGADEMSMNINWGLSY